MAPCFKPGSPTPQLQLLPGHHGYTGLPGRGSTGIWFRPESRREDLTHPTGPVGGGPQTAHTGNLGSPSSLPNSDFCSLKFKPSPHLSLYLWWSFLMGLCLHLHHLRQCPKPQDSESGKWPRLCPCLPKGPCSLLAMQTVMKPTPSPFQGPAAKHADAQSLHQPVRPSNRAPTQEPNFLPHSNLVVTLATPAAPPAGIAGSVSVGPAIPRTS